MSRKQNKEIRKLTERLAALLDELEEAIASLPESIRDVLTGPGGETAENDEGEPPI